MTNPLPKPALQQLAARLEFYRELGIYDFYRRSAALPAQAAEASAMDEVTPSQAEFAVAEPVAVTPVNAPAFNPLSEEIDIPRRTYVSNEPVPPLVSFGPVLAPPQRAAALAAIRDLIGDCQRCRLGKGRNKLVFADGDANAQLMFVGEGPGADEDAQGLPFVGRAGQLLNNMIAAMGLKREQVYIANIVKCRPPQNRKPEPDEAHTCMPFLERQIEVVRPRVLVALGATAATYLLGMRGSIGSMRGRMHDYRGIQTVVTYHPAFLLRDPTQKKEAWKDLQMAMAAMGLKTPARAPQV
ncbi:MAG TPA: uracil-DNA glycosylase [Acidobacteriaceae bacterium]|jgi:DNA polymerase